MLKELREREEHFTPNFCGVGHRESQRARQHRGRSKSERCSFVRLFRVLQQRNRSLLYKMYLVFVGNRCLVPECM